MAEHHDKFDAHAASGDDSIADPSTFRPGGPDAVIESSDREPEELHLSASRRLESAAHEEPVSFGRQMVQLTLVPALIVGAVMGVWLIIITLGGQSQSVGRILDRLETTPAGEGRELLDRPAHQERARAAVNLMGWLDDADSLSEDERRMLVDRLPRIARLYEGREPELTQYIMGALGLLAEAETLPVFEEMLVSDRVGDRMAAAVGLASWQGSWTELRDVVSELTLALEQTTGESEEASRTRALICLVLSGAAAPEDTRARDALANTMERFAATDRESAWNAGAALAALGDERGIPVLLTLLDRADLERRPQDPRGGDDLGADRVAMSSASQDKLIATAINVVIGFDVEREQHYVRVHDEEVWRLIEELAENDPSSDIRELAAKALAVRERETRDLVGRNAG